MGRIALSLVVVLNILGQQAADSRGPIDSATTTTQGGSAIRFPWDTAENARARQQLNVPIASLAYDGMPFLEVIDDLRRRTRSNIVTNWAALEFADIKRDQAVSMSLHDVSLGAAIRVLLEIVGGGETELAYEISDGVIWISTREDLSRRTVTAVHDCDDLLNVETKLLADYINRVIEAVAEAGGRDLLKNPEAAERVVRAAVTELTDDLASELIELIQQTVDPESWRSTGGNVGSIQLFGDRLVVVQTVSAQREIANLLERLRAPRPDRPGVGRRP